MKLKWESKRFGSTVYTNTTSEVPVTFTDVTSQFSGLNPNTVADETASATITLSNLPPATTTFAWIEAIDEAGNSSGIQPVGSATTSERSIIGRGKVVPGAIYSQSSLVNADYGCEKAFNGTMFPTHTAGAAYTHWLQVELPASVIVSRYRIWSAPLTSFVDAPIDWLFQGSNDGTNWQTLDTRVNSMPPLSAGAGINFDTLVSLSIPYGEYEVQARVLYRFYRLYVTKTGGGNPSRDTILKVSEIELLGG